MTGPRHGASVRRWRWPAAGAATVLAALLGVVLAVQGTGGAACAALPAPRAVPTGGTVHSGEATYYTLQSGGGNCAYPGPPADGRYVALSPGEYAAAGACGGYLDVTGPRGTVRVKIVDQCPECATGHVDLSRGAFGQIADPAAGQVPVTYRAVVDPPLPAALSFRVKEGASQWWFALLVIDHGNPLRAVEAAGPGGGFRALQRADYNYWLAASGLGTGPFTVRVTDVYGRQATVPGIRLLPGTVQPTGTRMYAAGTASRPASPSPAGTVAPQPPSPSPSGTGPARAALAVSASPRCAAR